MILLSATFREPAVMSARYRNGAAQITFYRGFLVRLFFPGASGA